MFPRCIRCGSGAVTGLQSMRKNTRMQRAGAVPADAERRLAGLWHAISASMMTAAAGWYGREDRVGDSHRRQNVHRILFLDPWFGASGDMLLGALLDLDSKGTLESALREAVSALGLPEARIEVH